MGVVRLGDRVRSDRYDRLVPAQGDHWQRVSANIINAPDNGTACDLKLATLIVVVTDASVHVDFLRRAPAGADNCTVDQALAIPAPSTTAARSTATTSRPDDRR